MMNRIVSLILNRLFYKGMNMGARAISKRIGSAENSSETERKMAGNPRTGRRAVSTMNKLTRRLPRL